MTSITWITETDERLTEKVSLNGRWHLNIKTATGTKPQMHLMNYDLLGSPSGLDEDLPGCLQQFIESCDRHAEKLAAIKAEAQQLLAEQAD